MSPYPTPQMHAAQKRGNMYPMNHHHQMASAQNMGPNQMYQQHSQQANYGPVPAPMHQNYIRPGANNAYLRVPNSGMMQQQRPGMPFLFEFKLFISLGEQHKFVSYEFTAILC